MMLNYIAGTEAYYESKSWGEGGVQKVWRLKRREALQ